MNGKFVVAMLAAGAIALSAAVSAEPKRLHTTKSEQYIVSVDNSFPGNYWGVVFGVSGDSESTVNGKRWSLYLQKQIVDCDDMTYQVLGGLYLFGGKTIHSFQNDSDVAWRIADSNSDNSLRVVEFCANTKIIGD